MNNMKKAIVEITPDDPKKYFDLQTNDVNKVQIEIGLRSVLKALQEEIAMDALKAVGPDFEKQKEWYRSQIPQHLKDQEKKFKQPGKDA